MKRNIIKLVAIAMACTLGLSSLLPIPALAADLSIGNACDNLDANTEAYKAAGCNNTATKDDLTKTIQGILNAVIGISSLVAVAFVIVGGVNYITSTGDPNKVKKARDTILYACIGLVVCALAFAIVNWTISAIGGSGNPPESSEDSEGDNSGGGGGGGSTQQTR